MKLTAIIAVVPAVACVGCTDSTRARLFGGTKTIELPAGRKLLNVTWKDKDDLWCLTRPMRQDETPESFTFQQWSSLGQPEGTVVLHEHR